MIEPVDRIISKLKSERTYDEIIYTLPMVKSSVNLWPISYQ